MEAAVRASISTPVLEGGVLTVEMTWTWLGLSVRVTEMCERGRGWQRGMSAEVCLAARMPAS